jgi:hypothetical protein
MRGGACNERGGGSVEDVQQADQGRTVTFVERTEDLLQQPLALASCHGEGCFPGGRHCDQTGAAVGRIGMPRDKAIAFKAIDYVSDRPGRNAELGCQHAWPGRPATVKLGQHLGTSERQPAGGHALVHSAAHPVMDSEVALANLLWRNHGATPPFLKLLIVRILKILPSAEPCGLRRALAFPARP